MTSRRQFLQSTSALVGIGAVVGTGAVAGCSGLLGQADQPVPVDGSPAVEADAQFRGGLRRQGARLDTTVPGSVEVDWAIEDVNTGDHTAAKASAVRTPDGDVVIPGDNRDIRRVAPDGTVRWTAEVNPTSRGIHGTPAIANGAVYVGAYDGALYAFDLESGERYWRSKLGDAIGSSPAYHDGAVYIAVEYHDPSGAMFAVDAITGEEVWDDQRITDHPHSTCAIDRETGHLVVGSNDGYLYAWSYPDLEYQWKFETSNAIKGPVAIHDGHAIFGSWDQHVYSVALADGDKAWDYRTGAEVMAGPAIADGVVYVGSHDSHLYALDAASGNRRWFFDADAMMIGCPTVTAETVLVGSHDRNCYAVDRETGRERWRVPASGEVSSTPLATDDAVYFACRASDAFLDGEGGPTGKFYRVVEA